jgi:HupF/HypC family
MSGPTASVHWGWGPTPSVPWGSTSSIPALVAPEGGACDADDGHCITCSDEGVTMLVVECRDTGTVCEDDHGDRHEVATDLVAPVGVGDQVLVHAGVAIRRLGVWT